MKRTAAAEIQGGLFQPSQIDPRRDEQARLIAGALAEKEALVRSMRAQVRTVTQPTEMNAQRSMIARLVHSSTASHTDATIMILEAQVTLLRRSPAEITPETKPLVAEYLAGQVKALIDNPGRDPTKKPFAYTVNAIDAAIKSGNIASLTYIEKEIVRLLAVLHQHGYTCFIPRDCGIFDYFDNSGRLENLCDQCYKIQNRAGQPQRKRSISGY